MKKLYNNIKIKYWNDPVWSKVISAGIITILSSVITAVYLLAKSILDKVSLKESFDSLKLFFSKATPINNLFILIAILIVLFLLIITFIKESPKPSKESYETSIVNQVPEELPFVGVESTVFFCRSNCWSISRRKKYYRV